MELQRIRDIDPDQAVLVAALRDVPLPEPADEFRLASVTNWHRLEGVLAVATRTSPVGSADLRDHLEDTRTATDARYAVLRAALVDLLGAWSEADIAGVLLKGAALVEADVVAAGDRPMADLDVLVAPADAEEAHRLARSRGFEAHVRPEDWAHARTAHHHLPALHRDQTMVEVHYRLLDGAHPLHALDDAIRGHTAPLDRLQARRLDDVALWLHLAVHFWDDRRRGTGGVLLQLRDLHLLLARLDVDDLVGTASTPRARSLLGAVAVVLDAVIPSDRADHLRRALSGPAVADPHVEAYVRNRVLGRRTALAQFIHPTGSVHYTPWRLVTRFRRQAWPPMAQLQRVRGPEATRRAHAREVLAVMRAGLRDTTSLRRDVWLDRWSHNRTSVP